MKYFHDLLRLYIYGCISIKANLVIIKNTLVSALLFGTSVDLRLVRQASAAAHVLTQWPFDDVGVLMTLELQNPLKHEVVKGDSTKALCW